MAKFPMGPVLEKYGFHVPYGRGGWAPMRCAEHDDRMASAQYNEQRQAWNCLTCGTGQEDAIDLVMRREGCDFRRAVEICEGITGSSDAGLSRRPSGQSRRRVRQEAWDSAGQLDLVSPRLGRRRHRP